MCAEFARGAFALMHMTEYVTLAIPLRLTSHRSV